MNDFIDILLSPHNMAHTTFACLVYWLGLYLGRRKEHAKYLAKPWKWSRQPPGWKPCFYRHIRRMPEPPPMPQIGSLMSDLDQAAAALSLYVWSLDQVETVLLIANHHLDRVQAGLDRVREIQRKVNESKEAV